MNPTTFEDDYTVCLNVQIPKDELPSSNLKDVTNLYSYSVPFCLVMYKRKALCCYRNRMRNMNEYIKSSEKKRKGRRLLVHNIMSVDTSLDYIGKFFVKKQRDTLKDQFVVDTELDNLFPEKKAIVKEAIDKLSYYSGLLHIIFLYLYRFGIEQEECFSIVLFFGH